MTASAVDASVAVKWVVAEDGSEQASRLLADEVTLVAPDLIYTEVANTLWKKVRRGEVDEGLVRKALGLLIELDLVVLPSPEVVETALEWATALSHPVHDCLYLAAAQAGSCRVVTADEAFVARVADPNLAAPLSSYRIDTRSP